MFLQRNFQWLIANQWRMEERKWLGETIRLPLVMEGNFASVGSSLRLCFLTCKMRDGAKTLISQVTVIREEIRQEYDTLVVMYATLCIHVTRIHKRKCYGGGLRSLGSYQLVLACLSLSTNILTLFIFRQCV